MNIAIAAVAGVGLYLAARKGTNMRIAVLDIEGVPQGALVASRPYALHLAIDGLRDAVEVYTYALNDAEQEANWFSPRQTILQPGEVYMREFTTPPDATSGKLYAEVFPLGAEERLGYVVSAYDVQQGGTA